MAEDKDKKGNELLGQDFLGDMQKNVDSMPTAGLFDKLAKLGAQQRLQPLADQKRFESGYKPLLKMVEDAEDRVTAGMLAYKLANPDIDDSKLHGGVGDLVTNVIPNITGLRAFVTAIDSDTQLTLSADIFGGLGVEIYKIESDYTKADMFEDDLKVR